MSRRLNRGEPRTHWVLLFVVMVLFMVSLLLSGLINGQVGEGAETPTSQAGTGTVPEAFLGGGPVVDAAHPRLAGLSVPARTIALTFDDGPDPVWTPKVLDVLARHHARATFFEIGSRGSNTRHRPAVVAGGNELGAHTFTHVEPATPAVAARRRSSP